MIPDSLDNHKHQQNLLETRELVPKKSPPFQFLTLRKKLIFGYALVGTIPLAGAVVGLMVGSHYQKESTQTLTATYQEQKNLSHLQVLILQNRPTKELAPFVENPVAFRQASDNFFARLSYLDNLVTQLKASKTQAITDFVPQLEEYQKTISNFSQELRVLVEESQSLQMKGQLGQRIMALAKSKEFSELVQFSDQIDRIATVIDQETRAAENQLQKAETLRMQIILASLIASVMTAILLAIVTGRSIAYPLEALTQVAQQVTRDANTNLRAPVSSRDEVGTLAHALNQLLEWVETYTRDLKDTQLNLVQAEKMSALGKMVAGVAHEINNPVNFIHGNLTYMQEYAHNLLGFVTLYQESYPDPTPAIQAQTEAIDMEFIQTDLPKLLNSMKMGTDRIRQIVLSLRNFSRLDEANFKDVDIHEGIDSTLLILRHRLKDKPEHPAIQVIRDYGNLPLVECYPGQLNQAFMNILSNAIDALEEVNAERTDEEVKENPSQIVIQTSMIDSNWIKILISDNGIGMPESVRSRTFDPFFTTKSVGKGTGLGMSISYQIVTEQHGGKLTCCSIPGEGTDFVIQIPIQQQIREAA